MDTKDAGRDRERGEGRTKFERFVEATYIRVSEAPFFFVCVGIVVVWLASYPLFPDSKSWQVAIHTVGSVLTLLLLVLLENASRRTEEAAQEKLNVLAEGLAALMDAGSEDNEELRVATTKLHEAIHLEERH